MIRKFIEVTNHGDGGINFGKFMVARFEADDVTYQSQLEAGLGITASLIRGRGWGSEHLFVLDLQTGEGAMFRHGGLASADLRKHGIWVCPMFEPFLEWLYRQDVTDLDTLPALLELTEADAPSAFAGYRRSGPDLVNIVQVGLNTEAKLHSPPETFYQASPGQLLDHVHHRVARLVVQLLQDAGVLRK